MIEPIIVYTDAGPDAVRIVVTCPECDKVVVDRLVRESDLPEDGDQAATDGAVDAAAWVEHVKTRHTAKTFECAICHKTFIDDSGLSTEEKMAEMKEVFGFSSQKVKSICTACHKLASRWWKRIQS